MILPLPVEVDPRALSVIAPVWLFEGGTTPSPVESSDALPPLDQRVTRGSLREAIERGLPLPPAGVVVLEAVEVEAVGEIDPTDPCERDPDAERYEDQVRIEGLRLAYYAWPGEWLGLPTRDAQWRNRLAFQIFERELRLPEGQVMPWGQRAVPVGLIAFDEAWNPLFVDRGAVVRRGGRPPQRRPLLPGAGTRFLWQARIEQFNEEVATAPAAETVEQIARRFRYLPPAGLLPREALEPRQRVSRFFPPRFAIRAAPVPVEQLDAVLEASAGSAPFDTFNSDQVTVWVPVPQQWYERDLLVQEQEAAEFQTAIARFVEARGDWLRRRDNLGAKRSALIGALAGAQAGAAAPPADEDQLEPEDTTPLTPAPAGLIHVGAALSGAHRHGLWKAPTPLALQAADTLYLHVQIDRELAMRQLLVEFHSGAADATGSWEHRFYLGENVLELGVDATPSRLRLGDLPVAGRWVRIEVSASELGLAGQSVNGVMFHVVGGRAAFGPLGVLVGQTEQPWVTAELVKASEVIGAAGTWGVVAVADADTPFEPGLGTTGAGQQRQSAVFETLLGSPDLAVLKGRVRLDAAGQTETELQHLRRVGLRKFVPFLEGRVRQADDTVDFSYLRIHTNLFRVRQSVLKQDASVRFAISPAIAQIAEFDNAAVSREQLAGFYQSIKGTPAGGTKSTTPSGPASPTAPRAMVAPSAAIRVADSAGSAALSVGGTKSINTFVGTEKSTLAFGGEITQRSFSDEVLGEVLLGARPADKQFALPATEAVQGAEAIYGKSEVRTVSIASRLEQSRSVEAKNFAAATRHDVVRQLAQIEIDVDDLDVFGIAEEGKFEASGQPSRTGRQALSAFRDGVALTRLLQDPSPQAGMEDEASYFLGGIELSDFAVATLRGVEGRIRQYKVALEACRAALAEIERGLLVADQRLAVVARELTEARSDVACARALYAEEQARVRRINARRDAIIAEHVTFLAFSRSRTSDNLAAVPLRALDSELEEQAVPACLADHGEPPPELRGMLDAVRAAPLQWFPALRRPLLLLDTSQSLLSALRGASETATRTLSAVQSFSLTQTAVTLAPVQRLSQNVVTARQQSVLQVRSDALRIDATEVAGRGWQSLFDHARAALSIADLQDALHGRPEAARRAAEEFSRIDRIATCLHAKLSEVRPALRLGWAERFSQFDGEDFLAGTRGDLTRLPRFLEIDEDLREDLMDLAQWLVRRVDAAVPEALGLMNDLLRVCVLAASHSPVNEIVTGRLPRPVRIGVGKLIDVLALRPDRVRVGMLVSLFKGDQVAAQAVVSDVKASAVSVQVVQAIAAEVELEADARVHFSVAGMTSAMDGAMKNVMATAFGAMAGR